MDTEDEGKKPSYRTDVGRQVVKYSREIYRAVPSNLTKSGLDEREGGFSGR